MTASTPWGPAQSAQTLATGIVNYSTAGHGGISLTAERIAQMPTALREVMPCAGEGWYEEDEDWALVALSFPAFFSPSSVASAVAMASVSRRDGHHWGPGVSAWLRTDEARTVLQAAQTWREAHADHFHWVAMGSVPGRLQPLAKQHEGERRHLSYVTLRRVSDNAPAAALLFDDELVDGVFDLAAIPAGRIVERPIP